LRRFAERIGVDLSVIFADDGNGDGELSEKEFMRFVSKQGREVHNKISEFTKSL